MTFLFVFLTLLGSSIAHAEDWRLHLSPVAADARLDSTLEGMHYSDHAKGTMFSLGLDRNITDDWSLGFTLGYGELGHSQETDFIDRTLKILPSYAAYRFSSSEYLYVSTGLSLHRFSRVSKDFEGYGALVGLGIHHEKPDSLGMGLSVTYEKSLSVQTYQIEGVSVKNRYSSLELAASLSYGF